MEQALILEILLNGNWGEHSVFTDAFLASPAFPLFQEALQNLDRSALYMSHVHGTGHIERTLLHGAMCAAAENLSEADTRLLLLMCSYHDTGRNCDWLDPSHGARSAEKLASLTGLSGEDLTEAKAGVEAHSVNDRLMPDILERYAPENAGRAKMLAEMLKDADGLDRVRIGDLNVSFLRREPSRARGAFAQELFDRYRALETSREPEPAEGYDLPLIQSLKTFTTRCYAEGKSCAQTALLALGNLTGYIISQQLLDACAGGTDGCSLLHAGLLFLGVAGTDHGLTDEQITVMRGVLRHRFINQYGSELCKELKTPVGCGGFSVDVILFIHTFLMEGNLQLKKKK